MEDSTELPDTVVLNRDEAMELAHEVLTRHGFTAEEADIISNHLVEAELRGQGMTGLIRLRSVVQKISKGREPIRVVNEGPNFAHIDGGNNPAYLAGEFAVRLAIEKARKSSIAVAGLWNSALGGMSGHYVRIAARDGFVGALFSNSYGRVAPHGGIDPLVGTNPIAFGFPCDPEPIVVDAATSAINNGDVEMARLTGEKLPAGVAIDSEGNPTQDPSMAVRGAVLPFAGHKGYALGLTMQLFGLLVGGDAIPENLGNFGFFFLVVDPSLFGAPGSFRERASFLRKRIKSSRRAAEVEEILLPGEGSERRKREKLEKGIRLPVELVESLRHL